MPEIGKPIWFNNFRCCIHLIPNKIQNLAGYRPEPRDGFGVNPILVNRFPVSAMNYPVRLLGYAYDVVTG